HEWRRLAFDLWTREVLGLPGPHDSQIFHVIAVDLIESRIPRASIGAEDAPLSVARCVLRHQRSAEQSRDQDSKNQTAYGGHESFLLDSIAASFYLKPLRVHNFGSHVPVQRNNARTVIGPVVECDEIDIVTGLHDPAESDLP